MRKQPCCHVLLTVVLSAGMALSQVQRIQTSPRTEQSPPAIASFTPASGPVGSTVTIQGDRFGASASENTVYFGAVKAAVNEATSASLTVTVPVGAAYAPITVTAGSLTAYSAMPFTPTFPSCRVIDGTTFIAKVDFKVWGSIGSIAAGDLDGDGKIDLVTTSKLGVTVFRNQSHGAGIDSSVFVDRVDLPSLTAQDWITGIVLADIDGDGRLDVVTSIRSSDSIAVFLNTGTPGAISFGQITKFAVGTQPQEAAVADLDGDGKPDVVVANAAGGWGTTISVLRNTTTGGHVAFDPKVDLTSGDSPYSVCLRDIDGDLRPDIVVANKNSVYLSVFRNISAPGSLQAGSFEAKADFPLPEGGGAYHIAPCDIDGDGRLDLALAQGGAGSTAFSLLRNISANGSLSFEPQVVISVLNDSRDAAAGDLDGDGRPDLAASSWEANALSVMRNAVVTDGFTTQSFQDRTNFMAGTNTLPVLIADFDLDGKPDVAVGNYNGGSISIFRNAIGPPTTEVDASNPSAEDKECRLSQNYPNPFNAAVRINYQVRQRGRVLLRVFDAKGHPIITLVDQDRESGSYEATWNGRDGNGNESSSGIYFVRLDTNGFTRTGKMVLLR